jgi:uncharacterized LabA/DUF88 family protein
MPPASSSRISAVFGSTALFVDAGFLLAAAALEVLGTPFRDELSCDYRALIDGIVGCVDHHSGELPRLRTYWYDAAPDGMPTYEHERIAGFPYVKVRLGRLNRARQQKGVDVLIYQDLLTLARERAVSRAYLVAGDEDLREGVVEAQKVGVQVVLLGMPIERGHNQSARLVRECDEYLTLPREAWEPHFSRRTGDDQEATPEDVAAARKMGGAFARDWAQRTPPEEIRAVLNSFPTLPQRLDIELLLAAEEKLGSLRGRTDLKTELRGHFWLTLNEEVRGLDDGQQSEPDSPDARSR